MIDHIVYATPDLQAGVDELNRRFGVRLTPGGHHVTLGTRNFLADLGDRTYLEVLGPDPDLPAPVNGRPLGIDQLTRGRVATWAARVADVDEAVRTAAEQGCTYGPVMEMSRHREDGARLAWRVAGPAGGLAFDGAVPLLIQWTSDAYAAELSVKGVRLVSLGVSHPEAATVRRHLDTLGLADDVTVRQAAVPALRVVLGTRAGEVELA